MPVSQIKEHELLLKLESAGLNDALAQAVIESPDNVLAMKLLTLAEQANLREKVLQDQWVERERRVLEILAGAGLPKVDVDLVAAAWTPELTFNHRFQPAGLTQIAGLEIAQRLGIKINGGSVNSAKQDSAESIPTEAGIFCFDTEAFARPTDKEGRPFMLTHDEQDEWAKAQGGSGLWSVEEGIYNAFLRPFAELGLIPYMGGTFRTRNEASDANNSFVLEWFLDDGLGVGCTEPSKRLWGCGAGVRKFQAVA